MRLYNWIGVVLNAFFASTSLWAVTLNDGWFWLYVCAWPYFMAMAGYWLWAWFDDRDTDREWNDYVRSMTAYHRSPSISTEHEGE